MRVGKYSAYIFLFHLEPRTFPLHTEHGAVSKLDILFPFTVVRTVPDPHNQTTVFSNPTALWNLYCCDVSLLLTR